MMAQPDAESPDCLLVFLADGQGGRAGGAAASYIACESALSAAFSYSRAERLQPETWLAILQQADRAVEQHPVAGLTTLIGLMVDQEMVCGASCGDSAVYLDDAGLERELTAAQKKNPPVGSGMAAVTPFAATLSAAARLLVMSDGVWKYAGWERIRQAVRCGQGTQLLESLKQFARLPGSGKFPDDFTVALIETGE